MEMREESPRFTRICHMGGLFELRGIFIIGDVQGPSTFGPSSVSGPPLWPLQAKLGGPFTPLSRIRCAGSHCLQVGPTGSPAFHGKKTLNRLPCADLAFDFHVTAVKFDQTLYKRQAQPGSLVATGQSRIDLNERLEKALNVLGTDTDPECSRQRIAPAEPRSQRQRRARSCRPRE